MIHDCYICGQDDRVCIESDKLSHFSSLLAVANTPCRWAQEKYRTPDNQHIQIIRHLSCLILISTNHQCTKRKWLKWKRSRTTLKINRISQVITSRHQVPPPSISIEQCIFELYRMLINIELKQKIRYLGRSHYCDRRGCRVRYRTTYPRQIWWPL